MAKMAATVDVIADGRLDFGIGAGGSRVAGPNPAIREFEAYGVPLVSPGEAVRDLAESLTVIRSLWTEPEPFDFSGPTLMLRGSICEPKPMQKPHPPIMVGGSGSRMLRVVAEHADIWNYPGAPDAEFHRRDAILNSHCAAIGRDPATITRSMQTIVRASEPDAVATTRSILLDMIDAGVRHIVLAAVLDGRPLDWLVEEIVEPVRAEAGVSAP
jgi:alkanesulfonate monooxygenase SsuD/methylene tetrahydromethanopterin reductase-like flavin-dependent oxidoreductase (luciferase family)